LPDCEVLRAPFAGAKVIQIHMLVSVSDRHSQSKSKTKNQFLCWKIYLHRPHGKWQPTFCCFPGYEVLGAPPPSSGGATVIQILKTLSAFDMPLAALGALGTHRIAEAFKHAFAMRMSLGDPDVRTVAFQPSPIPLLFPFCSTTILQISATKLPLWVMMLDKLPVLPAWNVPSVFVTTVAPCS
jgi:hypothetical protein